MLPLALPSNCSCSCQATEENEARVTAVSPGSGGGGGGGGNASMKFQLLENAIQKIEDFKGGRAEVAFLVCLAVPLILVYTPSHNLVTTVH